MCREKHSARPHTIRARYAHPTARPIRTRYVPDTRTPAHDTHTIRARSHTIRARYAHARTRYAHDTRTPARTVATDMRTPAHDTRTIRARWRTVARDVAGLSTTVLEECLWWCCSISVQELTRSDAVYVSASYPIRTKFPTKSLSCHQSEQ
mgnify:CR=1 FL=1